MSGPATPAIQARDATVPHRKIGADRVVPEPVDHGGAADHEVVHCHLPLGVVLLELVPAAQHQPDLFCGR
jgi:hypothetical protein